MDARPAGLFIMAQRGVQAQGRGVPVSGTIYGTYDYDFEGKGAWVGHALLSFGGKPPVAATFVDRNTSFGQKNNGAIYGTETISLSFTDGGTLEIFATFNGTPAATANLYNLRSNQHNRQRDRQVCVGFGPRDGSRSIPVSGPRKHPRSSAVDLGNPRYRSRNRGALSGREVMP